MVRDVNTVRVNEEACQRRFDAFSRVFVSFFFLRSQILSRIKFFLSVLSLSLSLSFCCCYLRMMIVSLFFDVAFGGTSGVVVFSRSRKREKEYIWVVVFIFVEKKRKR